MNKKNIALALGLSSILLLSACGKTEGNANSSANKVNNNVVENTNAEKNATVTETAEKASDAPVLEKEVAFNNFTEMYKGAKITSFKLTEEKGSPAYEIDGYDSENEIELKLDASDGTVIKEEKDAVEKDDDNKKEITIDMLNKIDGFIEKADKEVKDGYVLNEYSLETDDGKLILELEYTDGTKDVSFDYDFESGELLEQDM
ncbi:PepSY domain-containing protein [Peptoniphilus sp.]|jgi:uncharacterized membrane protein YkoI|uniref:PepSY domain-containing protein n=1 Tax=Peptoniphilus sp. TaxID=1971214 RepID=UPI003D925D07